jgi:hypothetical protein
VRLLICGWPYLYMTQHPAINVPQWDGRAREIAEVWRLSKGSPWRCVPSGRIRTAVRCGSPWMANGTAGKLDATAWRSNGKRSFRRESGVRRGSGSVLTIPPAGCASIDHNVGVLHGWEYPHRGCRFESPVQRQELRLSKNLSNTDALRQLPSLTSGHQRRESHQRLERTIRALLDAQAWNRTTPPAC